MRSARPNRALLVALGVAVALWLLSRTQAGQVAVAEVIDVGNKLVRGLRNNNPGNLRKNAFLGFVGLDAGGYAIFDTLHNGIRASARQLKLYRDRGVDTIREIITTWAPASENNTAAYIAAVTGALGIGADVTVSGHESTQTALLRAIFRHENGAQAAVISDADILAGVRAA